MKRGLGRGWAASRRRWAPAIGCAVVLLTPLAAAGQGHEGRLVFATGGDGASGRLELAVMRPNGRGFRKLTHQKPRPLWAAWTTSGSLAFATHDLLTDRGGLWLMRGNGTGIQRLSTHEEDAISPDGKLVARLTDAGTLEILRAGGGLVRRIALGLRKDDYFNDLSPLWSPDGRRIAVDVATESATKDYSFVIVARVHGSAEVRRITPQRDGHQESAYSWSPDGRWLVVDAWSDLGRRTFHAVSPDGGRRRLLVHAGRYGGAHAWASDSRRLAFVGPNGDLFVIRVGGGRKRIARTKWRGRAALGLELAWSSRGVIAYVDSGGAYLIGGDGSGRRPLVRRSVHSPAWSPDGTRLTLVSDTALLIARPSGSVRTLLSALWDDSPSWSPDGSRIAFVRGPAGLRDPDRIAVQVMQADGKRLRRLGSGYGPVWSPDGRRVAFVQPLADPIERAMEKLGAGRIVVADATGSSARVVGTGTAPAWLPNGRELSFMRYAFRTVNEGERDEQTVVTSSTMSIVGADGANPRELFTTEANGVDPIHYRPAWSPDGSVVAFASETMGDADPDRTSWSISLYQIATGETRTLAKFHAGALAWSPDGGRVAITAGRSLSVLTVADGSHRRIAGAPEEVRDPVWSPDGRRIGFISCMAPEGRPANCDVHVVDAAGRARKVTKTPGFEGSLDWR
jgi:Tol biopolymer transport system component